MSFHEAPKAFLLQWLEGRGERLIYMPRYNSNFNVGMCYRCADMFEHLETDPNCPVCFGTGFTDGWGMPYTGINSPYQRVYGIFGYNTVITDWDQSGPVTTEQDQKLSVALLEQPALGDLIIDHLGNRYRVGVNVRDWSFSNDHIGWHITVNQVGLGDPIYSKPIPAFNTPNLTNSQDNYSNQLQLVVEQPVELVLEVNSF